MRLGLHVSDFNWAGGPAAIPGTLADVALHAEQVGFDRLTVMDHVWQISAVGPAEESMLEAYATLGYLAAKTSSITLHAMVTAVSYRSPGLLAKTISTLDVLSGGRMMLGLGAAWFEEEARGLGLDYPSLAERFERLEETLQICRQMWAGDETPYAGKHYVLDRPLNHPLPPRQPRILVGGSGEHKTLRMVAQYADACNIYFGQPVRAKLDVLRAHCERLGRNYDEIEKTSTMLFDVGSQGERVDELLGTLRSLHDDGITTVYGRMKASGYTADLEVIGREVIPVVAGW
jgi:F420-dependent oxidoreductase-like protein